MSWSNPPWNAEIGFEWAKNWGLVTFMAMAVVLVLNVYWAEAYAWLGFGAGFTTMLAADWFMPLLTTTLLGAIIGFALSIVYVLEVKKVSVRNTIGCLSVFWQFTILGLFVGAIQLVVANLVPQFIPWATAAFLPMLVLAVAPAALAVVGYGVADKRTAPEQYPS